MKIKAIKRVILLSLFLCIIQSSFAVDKYYFDYNARCKQAYEAMMAMRISDANRLLQQELEAHPTNLIPVMIADYGDCIPLLFNGDADEYRKRKNNFDIRLSQIEKGDAASPWYRYCKAMVYFHWAAVKVRFSENMSGANAFRKSFILIKENQKHFPAFKYNQILLGLEKAMIGTIPGNYKWIAGILGMKGNVKSGTALIVDFLNTRDATTAQMRQEAILYYCYLKFYLLSEQEAVWKYLSASSLDFRNNLLYVYLKASLALNDNKANIAEATLAQRAGGGAYLEVPVFNYMMGNALLLKMDADCVRYYKEFLSEYKGNIFIKDAYQKMSLYYYAAGNTAQGHLYRQKILGAGTTLTDADKQAQRFAQNATVPDVTLLKARLYSDGGYFDKALEQLNDKSVDDFGNDADKLEYTYRLGKTYQLKGAVAQAIPLLEAALKMGAGRQEQFGARAALELGQLYEAKGQNAKAISYYRQCANMKDHDFQSSIEQKAKAGINRLGGS